MKRTNVMLWGLVLVLAGLGLNAGALAGDKTQKGTASKAGSTSAELDILFRLAGRWKVEEQYPAAEGEEEGPKGKGDVLLKTELDKTHLIGSYGTKCKELGTDVRGHMVFAHVPDSGSDSYRFWWFSNYGQHDEFVGRATNNNRALVFTREDASGDPDNPATDRRTFRFNGEDEVQYTWEKGSGKKYRTVMTATYTRKGKKSETQQPVIPKKRVMRGF